jgi:hypothetical protein
MTPSLVEDDNAQRYRVGDLESVLEAKLERDYFTVNLDTGGTKPIAAYISAQPCASMHPLGARLN